MAGKPCAKCGKSVKWLSQNKIEGTIYCEDCWKELTQEKKEALELKKQEKKEAADELKQEKKGAGELKKKEKKEPGELKNKAATDIIKKIFREKERIILFITATILVLIFLFPPFHIVYKGIDINSGYAFILSPPIPPITDLEIKFASNINIALLFVQYLFTVTIGGILWFVFKKDSSSAIKTQGKRIEELGD